MSFTHRKVWSKVPEVTLSFWIIKILATTLGETGGDTVTMTLNWGYLTGTAIFLSLLAVLVVAQIAVRRFYPLLYWATIVASTTAGTTMADFADRSLGIGYTGGSALLLGCVLGSLGLWYWSEGTISVETVNPRRSKPSTGPRSPSRRLSEPRLATGWRIRRGSATRAARWSSPSGWQCSRACISGATCRACCCSGSPSS